jgi:hypothetical protein
MAPWAGWGAGPAGAGASGGPSRPFQAVAALCMAGVGVALATEGRWGGAVACAGAVIYFVLRATGRLGPGSRR